MSDLKDIVTKASKHGMSAEEIAGIVHISKDVVLRVLKGIKYCKDCHILIPETKTFCKKCYRLRALYRQKKKRSKKSFMCTTCGKQISLYGYYLNGKLLCTYCDKYANT